jgi:hypothetical protein
MLRLVKNEATSTRRKQLAWVEAILAFKQWNPTRLAREAAFSQSTLAKFLNDPDNEAQLSTNIVEKIAVVGGLRPYETEPVGQLRGLSDAEAEPFQGYDGQPEINQLIRALVQGNATSPWVLNSRALEAAGYLPGDILVVDQNAEPRDGDVVCAQVYDRSGGAETVFRIYERPYLVAATLSRSNLKPLIVDDDMVSIRGVVTSSHRPRLTLLAS